MATENTDSNKPQKISETPEVDLTNPEFRTALSLLGQSRNSIFLTGKAGTGKSTFLRYITSVTKRKYVVLAPTGIAAVNVGGQTLHSFFRIPLKPLLPDDPEFAAGRLRKRLKIPKDHAKLLRELDLIIIDEISMVRADVIDFIDKVLRVYSGNMRQPFGGKQLLLVGDVFQLEPVVTGDDRDVLSRAYTSFYFFNARVFSELEVIPIELTKVYRQDEQNFIRILDNVRMGRPTTADISLLNSRCMPVQTDSAGKGDMVMTIATRRDMVDAINASELAALPTPAVSYTGVIYEDFPTSALPTDMELTLKVGAQVVFIKNDQDKRWVNGTLAVVESCDNESIKVRTEDGVLHNVEPVVWSNVRFAYNEETKSVDEIVLGTFTQYPLKLAWALTIHKSQGLTFNKVIIDVGRGAFAGGQTYVALSRCRTLEGISLQSPISQRDVYVRPEITRFASRFNNNELISRAIEQGRADGLFAKASESLAAGNTDDALSAFVEAIKIRPFWNNPTAVRLLRRKLGIIDHQRRMLTEMARELTDKQAILDDLAAEYISLADACADDGWDAEAALANYDKALRIAPGNIDAMLGRGNILVKMGRYDEAESTFTRCATSELPESWKGYIAIGDMNMARNELFGAIAVYLLAYDIKDGRYTAALRLADAYDRADDPDVADGYRKVAAKLRSRRKK